MLKLKPKNEEELARMLKDAWLNIYIPDEDALYNPLMEIPEYCENNPEIYFTFVMSNPEYFSFVCKEIFNIEILPFQGVILNELWRRRFPMLIASRGASKSYTMAIYALLRMLFLKGRKIIVSGSGFRQSKIIFNYMENIYANSPLLRDIMDSASGGRNPVSKSPDEWVMRIGESITKCIPIGDGSKARGQRAHDVLVDEFASIPIEIFETVLAQFAAVSSSVVNNTKRMAALAKAKEFGYDGLPFDDFEIIKDANVDNQIVISGTAYYDFNHFAQYHKRWAGIIKSRGELDKLAAILNDKPEEGFEHSDYSIIRIPYDLLPKGMMDDAQIMRSKATMTLDNFQRELGCVFSKDSNGFFKRSLLEKTTVEPGKSFTLPNGYVLSPEKAFFEPQMYGDPKKDHVISVDPASMVDNFAVTVLELNEEGGCAFRKIVHCWTTNKKDHQEKLKLGLTKEHNFYAYACRKIRHLMKNFNTVRLSIDSEGGGREIMAQFTDRDKLEPGELPIYHIIDPLKPNPQEDGEIGLHIIDEIHFSSAEWTTNANHGLKKDFEDNVLLFPYIDAISVALADSDDEEKKRDFDTLSQCIKDIEELKNELTTIVVTETVTGRERWDTPEVKLATGKKGRMRKDRYSALLMGNMTARMIPATTFNPVQTIAGGFSNSITKKEVETGSLYQGPSWITQHLQNLYD